MNKKINQAISNFWVMIILVWAIANVQSVNATKVAFCFTEVQSLNRLYKSYNEILAFFNQELILLIKWMEIVPGKSERFFQILIWQNKITVAVFIAYVIKKPRVKILYNCTSIVPSLSAIKLEGLFCKAED